MSQFLFTSTERQKQQHLRILNYVINHVHYVTKSMRKLLTNINYDDNMHAHIHYTSVLYEHFSFKTKTILFKYKWTHAPINMNDFTLLQVFKSAFRVAINVLSKSNIIVENRFVNWFKILLLSIFLYFVWFNFSFAHTKIYINLFTAKKKMRILSLKKIEQKFNYLCWINWLNLFILANFYKRTQL